MPSPNRVLLIDDDTRMEQMLLEELRFPATRIERDPSGASAPDAGKVGLVLLNAEFQKNFVLCRRYKKGKHTEGIPLAFFTFSHDREHLRILAEHRGLPTHADHYLMPPVTSDKVRDLIVRTLGAFEPAAPPAPVVQQPPPAVNAPLGPVHGADEFLAADDDDEDQDLSPEPTADDTPALLEDAEEERTDASLAAPALEEPPESTEGRDEEPPLMGPPPALDVPQDFAPGAAGFQSDRMSSVESYIRTLHDEFKKVQEQLASQHEQARVERDRLHEERNEALKEVREEIGALRTRTAELEKEATKLQAEKDRLQVELLAVESATPPARAADAELVSQVGLLERRVRDLEAQVEAADDRLQEAEAARDQAEAQLKAAREQCEAETEQREARG